LRIHPLRAAPVALAGLEELAAPVARAEQEVPVAQAAPEVQAVEEDRVVQVVRGGQAVRERPP
jgi:hypothetical protein